MFRSSSVCLLVAIGLITHADDPPPAAKPEIKQLSANRFRLGAIEFDQVTREIFLPAKVNLTKGSLEYALTGGQGKLHETLLSTSVKAFDLNVVLLLLNYEPDETWYRQPNDPQTVPVRPKPLAGVKAAAQCDLFVRWKSGTGTEQEARLETWIFNTATNAPATTSAWVFNGSLMTEDNRFAADVDESIIALYLDGRALINSPRAGNDDDEIWEPAKQIPPKNTPVTVVVRPPATVPGTAPKPDAPKSVPNKNPAPKKP